MQVALDEGPGPPIKYEYPDFCKLHQVVSNLIRCTDLSLRCESSTTQPVLPNPHAASDTLVPISPEAYEYLFGRTSYIKKLTEDTNVGEDGVKLLQYCSWENPQFSHLILTELMWQCGYAYWQDLRHHTELLLQVLLMEDSWQSHRIHNAVLGVAEERDGLLDTIHRSKTHYQKRAYIIIKMLVHLFRNSSVAHSMLKTTPRIAQQWTAAVEWLQDELEKGRGSGGQYNYNSWSPPVQSNDNTNGYMLERSQSAKNILQKAFELCPDEEQDVLLDSDAEQVDDSSAIEGQTGGESRGAQSSVGMASQSTTATTSTSSDTRTIVDHIQPLGEDMEAVVRGVNQIAVVQVSGRWLMLLLTELSDDFFSLRTGRRGGTREKSTMFPGYYVNGGCCGDGWGRRQRNGGCETSDQVE